MAVDMPSYAFQMVGVEPDLGIAFARTEGGLVVTSRKADPFWRGRMTTDLLDAAQGNNEHADFRAFLSRCVDLNQRVDFIHPRHKYPSAYTAASWPMIGNAVLEEVTDLRNIVVSGLDLGLELRRGDRLSIVQGALIAHRWIATAVTVSSITVQAIELTPRLPTGVFAAAAAVVLENPKMRLMIVPGSWNPDEVGEPTAISFDVMESLP